jgi:hypothetical protein
VDPFVRGTPPELVVGDEQPLERNLALIGTAVLALGLTVAAASVPELGLTAEGRRRFALVESPHVSLR